jgi:two-component system chemotaxis response regulator CheY
MEDAGHAVELASDGMAALDLVGEKSPAFDLVITDHQMPRMDGLGLVAKLRELGYPARIIVHSSTLTQELGGAYRAFSVDYIVMKGADTQSLPFLAAGLFPNMGL